MMVFTIRMIRWAICSTFVTAASMAVLSVLACARDTRQVSIKLQQAHLKETDGVEDVLLRYVAASEAWHLRLADDGRLCAIGHKLPVDCRDVEMDGTHLIVDKKNGTMSIVRAEISFGEPSCVEDRKNRTCTHLGVEKINVTVKHGVGGTLGWSSYVSIRLFEKENVYLEIFEDAPVAERRVTARRLLGIINELQEVLTFRELVESSGRLPQDAHYSDEPLMISYLTINDDYQPGIYTVNGAVNPGMFGYCNLRVFDLKSNTYLPISLQYPDTIVGWSSDNKVRFPYRARVTILGGSAIGSGVGETSGGQGSDVSSAERRSETTRFELWHRSDDGHERKLLGEKHDVRVWER